uniref:DUF834 domain-containing protein n=1 Tax=Oryza glaberrima TaxID=4538 RepID=I1PNK1_ORYGL
RRRWISLMLVCSVCMPFACGCERKQSSFAVNTDDGKGDNGKKAGDAGIREGNVVDSLAGADRFTDSDNIGYIVDSLANNTFVADSLEETDAEEKNN